MESTTDASESLVLLGLGIVCTTCGTEIEFAADGDDFGLCRHCGMAFAFDPKPTEQQRAS